MIGVILAAGKGSRLGSYTVDQPKSLLPLNSHGTLLDYNLRVLKEIGIEKILIVAGFSAEKIQHHVRTFENIQVIYNPFWYLCNVLGSLYMALPYLKDDFLFLHADTLVDVAIWKKLVAHPGEIVFPYVSKACGNEEMKVRHDENGRLIEVSKTMPNEWASGEFLGIAKFTASTVPMLRDTSVHLFSTGRLDFYMEAAVQDLIEKGLCEVQTFDIGTAPFVEVDFEEDYRYAREVFAQK